MHNGKRDMGKAPCYIEGIKQVMQTHVSILIQEYEIFEME